MKTGRKLHILAGLILVCFATAAQRSSACNLPPVAYVSNWQQFVGLDAQVTLDGTSSYDSDGYIAAYEWTFPSTAYNISGRYSSVAYCRFNSPGDYYVYLDVWDDDDAWDSDYAHIYVIQADLTWDGSTYLPVNCDDDNGNQIQDMLDSSAGAEDNDLRAIHLDITPDLYGGDAQLSYSGNATIKVWQPDATNRKYALITLPHTWAAARVPSTLYVEGIAPNSAPNGSQLTLSYIKNGTTLHSDSVTFTVFDVQLDTSFPVSVSAGAPLLLNCTRRGDATGLIAWSPVSGPSTPSFSPTANTEDPYFSATVSGSYTVRVQYTIDGATVTRTTGTITVNPVSVDITRPAGPTVERYYTLQLDCIPHGGIGSDYQWSQLSGPGSVSFSQSGRIRNPTFMTNETGDYLIGLQCKVNGITVNAAPVTITVVDVDITAPSSFPVSVARGSSLALDCVGRNGTASGYTWTPADLITPSNIRNPSFTSDTAGIYMATVNCTVWGISVSDTRSPIHVVEVASVAENTTGQDPIYVGLNSGGAVAYLQAQPYPNVSWPNGKPTWSVVIQPPGAAASIIPASNGAAVLTGITTKGLYRAKAICGSVDDGDTVDVTAFEVGITAQVGDVGPLALPIIVGVGASVVMDCIPSPDVGGQLYTWTVTPDTGAGFSNRHVRSPTLTITAPGTYTVRIDYTKEYGPSGTTASASGSITASDVTIEITTPSDPTVYVPLGNIQQLDCMLYPEGIIGTTTWSQVSGPSTGSFSDNQDKDPTFTANVPGQYLIKVDGTAGSSSASDSCTVVVWNVDLDADTLWKGSIAQPGTQDSQDAEGLEETQLAIVPVNCDDDDGDKNVHRDNNNILVYQRDCDNDKIDGEVDWEDFAPMVVRQMAPGSNASLTFTGPFRVFKWSDLNVNGRWDEGEPAEVFPSGSTIPDAELSSGDVLFLVEATRFLEPGETSFTFQLRANDGTGDVYDTVNVRPSPFILLPASNSAVEVYAPDYVGKTNPADEDAAITGLGTTPVDVSDTSDYYQDPWLQDEIEIGYTSWPNGQMWVVWDLPRNRWLDDWPETALLGLNCGHFNWGTGTGGGNYGGNIETTPPVTYQGQYRPLGVVVTGSDCSLGPFILAQGVQPVLDCDTSWLEVGHIDEVVSFTSGGVLIADTDLMRTRLEEFVNDTTHVYGTVTGGTLTYLEDTTQNWQTNQWVGAHIHVVHARNGFDFSRRVLGNDATRLYVYDEQQGTGTAFTTYGYPEPSDNYILRARSEFRVAFNEGKEDTGVFTYSYDSTPPYRVFEDHTNTKNWAQNEWVGGYLYLEYLGGYWGDPGFNHFRIVANTSDSITAEVSNERTLQPTHTYYTLIQKPKRPYSYYRWYRDQTPYEDRWIPNASDLHYMFTHDTSPQGGINAVRQRLELPNGPFSSSNFTNISAFFFRERYWYDTGSWLYTAFIPPKINLLNKDGALYMPDPFGLRRGDTNATDAFKDYAGAVYVDDWVLCTGGGDIHCGTNVRRTIPSTKWWNPNE
jgi:hypothetical protein